MATSTQPIFILYVVWHPDYAYGGKIAELLRERFGGVRHRDFAGDRGLSVIFRSAAPPGGRTPLPVDWDAAEATAVVVPAESMLAGDSAWSDYVRELVRSAQRKGLSANLFPVAMESAALGFGFEEQALRWDRWEGSDAEREHRLVSNLTHEFSRMLRHRLALLRRPEATEKSLENYLQKIRVFISHSKHDDDGETAARSIRDWLHDYGPLSSFFDVADIPPGTSFHDVLLHGIETSAVVALHTDSYSSREWCRREIIEAKRRAAPLIVVDCLREGDRRSIPYMGNAPIVRMNPGERNRLGAVIECLLEEVFRTYLWRCRVERFREKHPGVLFTARPPELIALAALPASKNETDPAIVYPEPPLGADEVRLFETIAPKVRVWTLTEWPAATMRVQETVMPPTAAISISESPDMPALGLSDGHLQDAMVEIALHLLATGTSLAYGGDLRAHGFTELLFELVERYQDHPRHSGRIGVTDYLAWPVHIRMTADDLAEFSAGHEKSMQLVLLALDGARMKREKRLELPAHEPDENEWNEGLTAMRSMMRKETQARIVLGGRVAGYKGRMPGIAEETLLSLRARQPVFLLGGFGGCARGIAETLGLADTWAGSRSDWSGRSCFEGYSPEDLRNGLSEEENAVLARTPHIHQAVTLVSRGLRRVFNETTDTENKGETNAQSVH